MYVLFETLGNITIFCLSDFANRVVIIRIKLTKLTKLIMSSMKEGFGFLWWRLCHLQIRGNKLPAQL